MGCAGSLEDESVERSTGDGGLARWALARKRNSGLFVWLMWMKNDVFMISWGWTSALSKVSPKWSENFTGTTDSGYLGLKKNPVINRRRILEAESCGKYFPSVRRQKLWGTRLHLDSIMCKCLPCATSSVNMETAVWRGSGKRLRQIRSWAVLFYQIVCPVLGGTGEAESPPAKSCSEAHMWAVEGVTLPQLGLGVMWLWLSWFFHFWIKRVICFWLHRDSTFRDFWDLLKRLQTFKWLEF